MKIYFFHWLPTRPGQGNWERGYNTVFAATKAEAKKEISKRFSTCGLKPDLTTLRVVSQAFVNRVDASYSGCFD